MNISRCFIFSTGFTALGALPTSCISSMVTRSIQPLLFGATAAGLAGVVAIVFTAVCLKMQWINRNNTETIINLALSSLITYSSLSLLGIATGIIPGGTLGITMLITSIVLPILSLIAYTLCNTFCKN